MVVKNLVRCGLGAALMLGSAGHVLAQQNPKPAQPPPPQVDTQQYFRKPETALEYWRIMKHEIELGQFAVADQYLKGFLAKNPTDQELLQIHQKEGSSGFLRLTTIPEMAKDAQPLVDRVGTLVRKFVTDPARLQKLIKDLVDGADDPREVTFAINEMRKAGPAAVPALLSALIVTAERPKEHTLILDALEKLDHNTTPPLAAALAIDNPSIRAELINVFRKRGEFGAVPFLWYYAAAPDQSPLVRSRAQQALTALTGIPDVSLPQAKDALTREAEKYYRHQINLGGAGGPVPFWKWDGQQLISQSVTPSQAEELYGLQFAGQALKLDPGYEPAQVVFLSLALDKAIERAGISEPLSKTGSFKDLLTAVSPDLVIAVLRKALQEHRVPVILGATRALGELAEGKAGQPGTTGVPVLVQALNFPDRRVQIAAADAILRLPRAVPVATSRVTEVLRRAASLEINPKVLVADPNADRANLVAQSIQKAGYQVVISNTGTTTLQRLAAAADIDALLVDASLNDPQLAYLLPQLRSDIDAGRIPIIITAQPQQIAELERRFGNLPGVTVTTETTNVATLKTLLERTIKAQEGMPLTEAERKEYASLSMLWLARIARGEVPGYDARPVQSVLLQGLQSNDLAPLAVEAVGYLPGPEAQRQLARFVLDNTRTVPLRTAAAHSLAHSIQHFGNHLLVEQIAALRALFDSAPDTKLKSSLAIVAGALHPDARLSGHLLQRYVPVFTPPAAPKPAAPTEPKNDSPMSGDKS
jgi:CheY-like chemotaxis protein